MSLGAQKRIFLRDVPNPLDVITGTPLSVLLSPERKRRP